VQGPLRVAIVSRIYRPEPSAASFFLGAVADALTSRGHQVDVLTSRMPKGFRAEPRKERVSTFPVMRDHNGYVRGYVQYLSFDIPLIFRLLFMRRPDIIFVEPPPTTGVIVRLVCAFRGLPYVYDAADVWADAAASATNSQIVIRMLRSLERFALRGASHIATISQEVIDRLQELDIRKPSTVTGFGADTESFWYQESPIEPVFLYAGSYSVWHGAEVFIEAFAEFSRVRPGYTLRFIGNSTERRALSLKAYELGIATAVEFLDAVPADELQPMLTRATSSLASLRPESGYDYAFTTKAYSALACGCPIIFAGPGPTRTFIEEAGKNVNPGAAVAFEAGEIAQAMISLVDDAPDAKARASTAAWIKQNHSLLIVAQKVRSVIEAVARG
jgi:glycosyltransferase involved in cell wall biosynthesis